MHLLPSISFAALLATGVTAATNCTKQQRLDGAQLIITSYNTQVPGGSVAGFEQLPVSEDCHTYINPNGGPPVLVALNGDTTKDFAITTRQAFSQVTGLFTDYDNGTTIIHTNVTLGAFHSVPIPVTFYANVYLFYDLADCLMHKIQAFATIPTVVDGMQIFKPQYPPVPA